jgi:hypothetical protein
VAQQKLGPATDRVCMLFLLAGFATWLLGRHFNIRFLISRLRAMPVLPFVTR